jgi:outer membrane protein assembly factor BamD (BamD/ComL family)
VSAPEPVVSAPAIDVGAPLAAEVAYVDRARALLRAGQTEQGLSLLRGYEAQFPEARLLPEVLFLQLETLERSGRTGDARAAAQRLVDGFPQSPHAARARKLLFP